MFHSKFLLLTKKIVKRIAPTLLIGGIFFSHMASAEELNSLDEFPETHKTQQFTTISLEYLSWEELLRIDSGSQLDNAYANFYGNGLSFERETYSSLRSGVALSAAFLFGQANAGGTQSVLTYQTSFKKWYGGMVTARYTYRMTPTITTSVGPMALLRKISWPDNGTGYSLKSGSDVNLGLLGELGLRMTKSWEARLEMGTLAFRASTYWSVGLGYKY